MKEEPGSTLGGRCGKMKPDDYYKEFK